MKKLFVLLLLPLLFFACEKEYETHHANFYPQVGDTVVISETGCSGCGIYWELRNEPHRVVNLIKTENIPDKPGWRSGYETINWYFVATGEGSIDIDFWYWKPYEGRSSILKKHYYTIKVR